MHCTCPLLLAWGQRAGCKGVTHCRLLTRLSLPIPPPLQAAAGPAGLGFNLPSGLALGSGESFLALGGSSAKPTTSLPSSLCFSMGSGTGLGFSMGSGTGLGCLQGSASTTVIEVERGEQVRAVSGVGAWSLLIPPNSMHVGVYGSWGVATPVPPLPRHPYGRTPNPLLPLSL